MDSEKVLLIWTYLQIRHYLHRLGIAFDDFDPMENLEKFLTSKPAAESNLNLLLGEIENLTPEDSVKAQEIVDTEISSPTKESKESNKNVESQIFYVQNGIQEDSKEANKSDLVFDDDFDALLEQVDTPPVLKRQKLMIEETKTSQIPQKTETSKIEYSLLKKKTKLLPPWLRKGN